MRTLNRIVAILLAAGLFAGGLIVVIEVICAAFGQPPVVVDWPALVPVLTRNTWSDLGPMLVACGLVVLGLLLVFLGLRRGKPAALPLTPAVPAIQVETTPRSVENLLRRCVLEIAGVTAARVRVSRKAARIGVATPHDHAAGPVGAEGVLEHAEAFLGALGLAEPLVVKVRVHLVPGPDVAPAAVAAATAGVADREPGAGATT